MRNAVVAIFAVAVVLGVEAQSGQSCGQGEACPDGECCMLDPGARYGLPACWSLRASGDTCRPNNQPQDFWLSSGPDEPATLYTDVYWAVCPCQSGLECDTGTCA